MVVVAEKNYGKTQLWFLTDRCLICILYTFFAVPWSLLKLQYSIWRRWLKYRAASVLYVYCIEKYFIFWFVKLARSSSHLTLLCKTLLPTIKMVGRDHNLCVKLSLVRPESSMCLDYEMDCTDPEITPGGEGGGGGHKAEEYSQTWMRMNAPPPPPPPCPYMEKVSTCNPREKRKTRELTLAELRNTNWKPPSFAWILGWVRSGSWYIGGNNDLQKIWRNVLIWSVGWSFFETGGFSLGVLRFFIQKFKKIWLKNFTIFFHQI